MIGRLSIGTMVSGAGGRLPRALWGRLVLQWFFHLFDNDLGLAERVEDFTVQQFVPHSPVEAFAVSVLLGRFRL